MICSGWGLSRELYIIYALKFLSSFSYFSFSLALVLYLSEALGLSDVAAGWWYGVYGVLTSVFGVAAGYAIDHWGVRRSLLVGSMLGTAARLLFAVWQRQAAALTLLATLLPFAECLGVPVLTISVKRYTCDQRGKRTMAFSVFYAVMNVAALVAGPSVELWHAHGRLTGVFVSCAVSSALMGVLAFWAVDEVEMDTNGRMRAFVSPYGGESWSAAIRRIGREVQFWRLVAMTLLLVGARLLFRHLDATLPKYMTRVFGPDAPFGFVYALNPFLIVTLVPLIARLTHHIDHFTMILYGSFLSGLSAFWMLLGDRYWTVVLFVVTLSLGEAVYSPRVYDYTMAIAGRGSEGAYTSLASVPLFGVQLVTGWMSGELLQRFCPAAPISARHTHTMWLIIALSTIWSPVCMWLCRGWLSQYKEEAHREVPSGREEEDAVEVDGSGKDGRERKGDEWMEDGDIAAPVTDGIRREDVGVRA
ncbi:hypothetical protein CDCA_CDCA19G4680 [Cyanidium caldarium]|uniref:Major facilitator superfamily (MFS) profile domain-containing protein n=1 Tax=Cyanidium caldarium TaxID=2771 RepID=A0AAV9J252_CYACA|nr:hypothetical protein CDCA_CDCA19G4680 [Cyanidium caldarium]